MTTIKCTLIVFLAIFSLAVLTTPAMAQRSGHGYYRQRYRSYEYKGYHGYHGYSYKAPWYIALPYISSLTPLVGTIWHHPYFYSWAYSRYPYYGNTYTPDPYYVYPYREREIDQQINIMPETELHSGTENPRLEQQTQSLYRPQYKIPSSVRGDISDNPTAGYNVNGTPIYSSRIPLKQTDQWGIK